jgi:DDE superfamily endonuclease
MEDVLEVYHRPQDPLRPLVCLDETTKQLVGEVRLPIPAAPGRLEAYDSEYVRHGVGTLFMMVAPLEGWREVRVTQQKTRVDYAHCLKWLSDEAFVKAEKIILVHDNLNTHQPSSLYCAFAPEEACRLMGRFEFHYTPKHGSWLNMAETELSVMQKQCLDRRIENMGSLEKEVGAWNRQRNEKAKTIHWHFTTADARIKLKKLYPSYLIA